MIKICDESIISPLEIIFNNTLKSGTYPNKTNVIPVHKESK